jgi:hypothetical protein
MFVCYAWRHHGELKVRLALSEHPRVERQMSWGLARTLKARGSGESSVAATRGGLIVPISSSTLLYHNIHKVVYT